MYEKLEVFVLISCPGFEHLENTAYKVRKGKEKTFWIKIKKWGLLVGKRIDFLSAPFYQAVIPEKFVKTQLSGKNLRKNKV